MKTIAIIGLILALFLIPGCGNEEALTIEETPIAVPVPEPEPEPVVNETVEEIEVNETEPGDEDIVEKESSGALNFAVYTLKDLKTYPTNVTIRIGGTVMWRSEEAAFLHIIGWNKMGVRAPGLKYGDSWNHTFTEPGEITWFSTARPQIQGTITIVE